MNKNGDDMMSELQNMFKQEVDGNLWLRDDCEKEIEKHTKEIRKLKTKMALTLTYYIMCERYGHLALIGLS